MKEQLELLFEECGYGYIPSNLKEFWIYYRAEASHICVVQVLDTKDGSYFSREQYDNIREKTKELFVSKGCMEIHMLTLILCTEPERVKYLWGGDRFCWTIDTVQKRLLIYEAQAADFYGMKGRLEQWLAQTGRRRYEGGASGEKRFGRADVRSVKALPIMVYSIILANVIVYLICTFTGNLLYNKGALLAEGILERREYYRLLTAWFLHGGWEHLFNNMLILYFFGEIVEKRLGHLRFAILYILAGFGGSLCSLYYMMQKNEVYSSIGASGAVFGIEGALLAIVCFHKGRLETVTFGKLAFVILYSIYIGFRSTGIDNYAHIGGAVTGFLVCCCLHLTMRKAENT